MISSATPAGGVPEESVVRNTTHHFVHAEPERPRLDMLSALIQRGQLMPVIDAIYPVWEVAAAHRLVESSTPWGKVILRVVGDE